MDQEVANNSMTTPVKQNSKLPIISMAIFILLSLASVAFLYYQNQQLKRMLLSYQPQPSSTPSVQPTPDPTAQWKLISRKNWEFKVPNDWNYLECNDELIFSGQKIETDQIIDCAFDSSPGSIQIGRTSGQNKVKIPTNTNPAVNPLVSEKTTMMVDGKAATRQKESISDGPGQGVRVYVYVEFTGYTDIITLHEIDKREIFDQILSTFKFTDQKADGPVIVTPLANSKITSPVTISGTIPKSWTFEANFVIEIQDKNRNVIAASPSQVLFNNETDLIGKFSTLVNFDTTAIEGYIVIKSDNPSGLPELQKTFEIPVKFQ